MGGVVEAPLAQGRAAGLAAVHVFSLGNAVGARAARQTVGGGFVGPQAVFARAVSLGTLGVTSFAFFGRCHVLGWHLRS